MCGKDAMIRDDYDKQNEKGHRLQDNATEDIMVEQIKEHAIFLTHQTVQ